jgi:hypothetical protein
MASTGSRVTVEARARGPTGSPAALSAPITSAAVEKEIRRILLVEFMVYAFRLLGQGN